MKIKQCQDFQLARSWLQKEKFSRHLMIASLFDFGHRSYVQKPFEMFYCDLCLLLLSTMTDNNKIRTLWTHHVESQHEILGEKCFIFTWERTEKWNYSSWSTFFTPKTSLHLVLFYKLHRCHELSGFLYFATDGHLFFSSKFFPLSFKKRVVWHESNGVVIRYAVIFWVLK